MRTRGLTLLELMLALAGTSLVALSVGAMLSSVAYGTSNRQDLRTMVIKHCAIGGRLTAAVRQSATVLASTSELLVLWIHDNNEDTIPNLSEIQRIERHAATKQMRSYKAPATLSGADTAFPLATTNFDTATAALRGTADFPLETWGTGVGALAISLDESDPQTATLVSFRLTLEEDGMSDMSVGTAALRKP